MLSKCIVKTHGLPMKTKKTLKGTHITPGSTVRIKSGGPIMTVGGAGNNKNYVTCLWFKDDHGLAEHDFHVDALIIVEPETEKTTSPIEKPKSISDAVPGMW